VIELAMPVFKYCQIIGLSADIGGACRLKTALVPQKTAVAIAQTQILERLK
jgi:hypothetical protein